ncbi:MAG TPA: hypothetical protein VF104_00380 [Burkholderiales bacterium]
MKCSAVVGGSCGFLRPPAAPVKLRSHAGPGIPSMYVYIIAIGWLYVVLLMAATEKTLVAAVLTFLAYGLAPVTLLVWIFAIARRRPRGSGKPMGEEAQQPDRADPQRDE